MKARTMHVHHDQRGSSMIEFALSVFVLVMIMFGVIEMSRMLLVYNTIADATRAGVRYAIVHGTVHDGSCIGGCTDGGDVTKVRDEVRRFASASLLDVSRLTDANITVSYPDGPNQSEIGFRVRVTVRYPYDPFSSYFPLSVTLGSASQGIITF